MNQSQFIQPVRQITDIELFKKACSALDSRIALLFGFLLISLFLKLLFYKLMKKDNERFIKSYLWFEEATDILALILSLLMIIFYFLHSA